MVFWISVIVFIAGIMTYMFFPRSDQYQLDMYKQEGNVISFINQHQVAKDLMQQRVVWKDTSGNNMYAFPWRDLINTAPELMNIGDVYHMGEYSALNIDPSAVDGDGNEAKGYYTSAVMCLTSCESGADCYYGKRMTDCSTATEQYVVTYGYMPDWWNDRVTNELNKENRKQAWFRAMLKRTHGSVGCGLLVHRGTEETNELYSLDNSQKYIGYQDVAGKRVIPPAITKRLESIPLSTCDGVTCSDQLQDLMLCITPFSNPYLGAPAFWWDSLNNTGTGVNVAQRGDPLAGTISGDAIQGLPVTSNYAITGVMSIQKGGSGNQNLLALNSNTYLYEECTSNVCKFGVRQGGTDLVSVEGLPDDREFAFVYQVNGASQKLTLYFSKETEVDGHKVLTFTTETDTKSSPTTLSNPSFTDSVGVQPYLRSVRIYTGTLGERQINHNIRLDKKRFGL